jgi:chromosome segregation ATPase
LAKQKFLSGEIKMELEALEKRLDWLEKEHRKDRGAIADLTEKLAAYENNASLIQGRVKEVNDGVARFSSIAARLEQFDLLVAQHRSEIAKAIEDMENRRLKQDREAEVRRRAEQDAINKSLIELRSALDVLPEFRKGIQARVDEDTRLIRSIAELDVKINDTARASEEVKRLIRTVDDGRKNDMKRLADVQGEISSIRKRADEAREKADLNADSLRLFDGRLNEMIASESERRQAQLYFIEQQTIAQLDRDRGWKDWQSRFDSFTKQTATLDQQLAALEETQRAVKRSQDSFDDINKRLERRINEITEIQRLAEDRFRQEWVTFKADDQKRWTNYSVTQDEVFKDIHASLEKLDTRITALDDQAQTQQDFIQQTSETTETHLQTLMNWTHEYLADYQRVLGRSRPTR